MKFKKYIILIVILIVAVSSVLFFKGISLKKKQKLNVILIVVDSLRADHLGCYGYARDTSPNIDKFAKEGILFSNAFAQATITRLSVSSILTSLYPAILYGGEVNASQGVCLPKEFITLPEILKGKGYITAAFVAPNVAPELFGNSSFTKRWQVYDAHVKAGKDWIPGPGRAPSYHVKPFFSIFII